MLLFSTEELWMSSRVNQRTTPSSSRATRNGAFKTRRSNANAKDMIDVEKTTKTTAPRVNSGGNDKYRLSDDSLDFILVLVLKKKSKPCFLD